MSKGTNPSSEGKKQQGVCKLRLLLLSVLSGAGAVVFSS